MPHTDKNRLSKSIKSVYFFRLFSLDPASTDIWRDAFRLSLPVTASYILLGSAYGIVMTSAGFAWYWSLLSSLCIYTGAFQFVLCALVSAGASLVTVIVSGLLLNARQTFYSLTFLQDFNHYHGLKKLWMIHTLTDESYALNCTLPADQSRLLWMPRIQFLCWVSWCIGTAAGIVVTEILPFSSDGLDFCLTALFVTIFISQWKSAASHFPALSGAGIGCLCLAVFGPEKFMLPALIVLSAVLAVWNARQDRHPFSAEDQRLSDGYEGQTCILSDQEEG